MPLRPGARLGPYEIVSALGAGGMGEVYRARDPRLGRDVAIKVLPATFSTDPERLHRFEQEARAAAALNHPNILAVYDIGNQEGCPYIVSELLEGETLREAIGKETVTVRTALDHAIQVATGLAAAHDKGILHREARGVRTRVTFDPTNGRMPLWSPDGANIVFKPDLVQDAGIFQRPASGNGAAEQLFAGGFDPNSYSSDGRYIVYTILNNVQTNRDVGVLPLAGDRKPFLFLHGTYNETQGHLSPDARWMAYYSNESGTGEVYIQSFPAGGKKIRVSTAGGAQARWRGDGRELFYLSPEGRLMAVPIQTTPNLNVGTPVFLFETRADAGGGLGTNANYDVTADGQRFVVASRLSDADSHPITVVVNWMAGLKK